MNIWGLIKETSSTVAYGEAPVFDFSDWTVEELDELRARLHPVSQALALIKSASLAALGEFLGSKGFVRFGDRAYRVAPDRSFKLKESRQSEFWDLVHSTHYARRLFNPNSARVTGLRELADEWADIDTGELGWSAFEEFFFDVVEGEVKVSEMPADRAPKFIQESEDGKVEYRK